MGLVNDLEMRRVNDKVRLLAQLYLGKTNVDGGPGTFDHVSKEVSFQDLTEMAAAGQINEAENKLYECLDLQDKDHYEFALGFYQFINQFDEDFLEKSNYSREEISLGIESISREFGVPAESMNTLFKLDIM